MFPASSTLSKKPGIFHLVSVNKHNKFRFRMLNNLKIYDKIKINFRFRKF